MLEVKCNIWTYPTDFYRCITTNGVVMKNGELVMGGGIAKEAKLLHPDLPKKLGYMVKSVGNDPFIFDEYRIVSFPTKEDWKNPNDPELIRESASQIAYFVTNGRIPGVITVRPGCGLGRLLWDDVKPILEKYFTDERFIICHNQ